MNNKPFFWSIFPSFLAVTFLASLSIFIFAVDEYEDNYTEDIHLRLKEQAALFRNNMYSLDTLSVQKVDSLAKTAGAGSFTRYTVIKNNGVVIGDSESDPGVMDNHGDRPEIMEAYQGTTGTSVRFSSTLKKNLLYFALPGVYIKGESYVVRTAYPLLQFTDTVSRFSKKIGVLAFTVLLILIGVSFYISRRLSTPLKELTEIAKHYASGDFSVKSGFYINKEVTELAGSMNLMAVELDEKINKLTAQKNEQNAILESMVEGVIAVDHKGYIILINSAAAQFLRIDRDYAKNRLLHQVIRNSSIQKFADEITERTPEVERTIEIASETGDIFIFRLHGAIIKDRNEHYKGAVFIMHDITALKKAESIRKDFVANVSHELRTPLTSIKGFVETLMDGAAEDKNNREKFLKIINNHVERLNTIIQDLLMLSKLEKDESKQDMIEFNLTPANEIINNVRNIFTSVLNKKNIRLNVQQSCGPELMCNQQLIEEALINLLDNAIKYSDDSTEILIGCRGNESETCFYVKDQGQGIDRIHFPRLFERFYRVDKARSRKEGGTGLGLSIVKHIISLHKGRVEVDSEPGKGSEFTLILPNNTNTEK